MLKVFAQKSGIYFAGLILNRGLALFLIPIYTYYLQPKDYGILAVCTSIIIILGQLMLFSMDSAVVLFRFRLSEFEYNRFFATIWILLSILPLGFILILLFLGQFYGDLVFKSVSWSPYLQLSLGISYLSLIPSVLLGYLRSAEKALTYAFFSFGMAILTGGISVYLIAFLHWGVEGALYGQLIAGIIGTLFAHILIMTQVLPFPGLDLQSAKNAVVLYFPLLPHGLFIWLLNLSDRWILERYVPLDQIGIYNIAYAFGMLILNIGSAFALSFSPIYFRDAEDEEFKLELPKILLLSMFLPSIAGLSIVIFSPEILMLLTRPSYYGAALFVPFIVVAYWFMTAVRQPFQTVLEHQSKTKRILYISLVSTVINIALNLLFIPLYGAWAAAINTTLAFAVMAFLSAIAAQTLRPIPFPWKRTAVVFLSAIGLYFAMFVVIGEINGIYKVGLKGIFLIAFILLGARYCGIPLAKIKQTLFVSNRSENIP